MVFFSACTVETSVTIHLLHCAVTEKNDFVDEAVLRLAFFNTMNSIPHRDSLHLAF